jgi:drug/metabolite transporter (DMT)-like permease
VALLFYTMPAWAVLLSWLMWGERPSLSRIAQVTLALAGVVVVLKSPDSPWPVPQSLADYLALLAGFAFAVTNLMMRHMRHTATSARMLAMFGGGAGMAALAAVCATGIGMISAVPAPQLSWWVWILALCVAMLGGNMAFQYGAARLSAVTGSLIMLTEVLFATASSLWLGATHAELRTWIGGAMILAAAALAARGESANAGESAGETESARGPVSQ